MHTIETRKNIGFPRQKKDWTKNHAIYNKHTLKIAGHPVMEDWELNYMKRLAAIATSNKGNVLEVGFGMGLSAKAIQSHSIKSHFVIECHPEVMAKCIKMFPKELGENKLHLLSGFWEEVTPQLKSESFDGILFDTYPLKEEEVHSNHFWFFKEAYRLLKPGGVLTYYSDEAKDFSDKHLKKLHEAGFKSKNIKFDVCKVNPPKHCEYWQDKTMIVPIIRK